MSSSAKTTGWTSISAHLDSCMVAPRVLELRISHPPYNLLNGEILDGIRNTLSRLSVHDVGAVVLSSGLKDVYISHYDVGEIAALGDLLPPWLPAPPPFVLGWLLSIESAVSKVGLRSLWRKGPLAGLSNLNSYHECTHMLRSVPQVTVAMINGRAFGGGCELALSCDFRLMADTSVDGDTAQGLRGSGIGQPEITLGLIPGGGGTQMLTRILGPARALDVCINRPLLDANEALKLGLVNELRPYATLRQDTVRFAQRLALRSPAAVAAIKQCVHVGASGTLQSGMQYERTNFAAVALVPESQSAMKKYLAQIDLILGSEAGLDAFAPLSDGTFADLVPRSNTTDSKKTR